MERHRPTIITHTQDRLLALIGRLGIAQTTTWDRRLRLQWRTEDRCLQIRRNWPRRTNVPSATASCHLRVFRIQRSCERRISVRALRHTAHTEERRLVRALVRGLAGLACFRMLPRRRTVWTAPSAQFVWKNSRWAFPWHDSSVSADSIGTVYQDGSRRTQAGALSIVMTDTASEGIQDDAGMRARGV